MSASRRCGADRRRRDSRPRAAVARSRRGAARARGARVTFAGSPDRLEARLVPEAGFEFHPYRVSGLPRRPSLELAARARHRRARDARCRSDRRARRSRTSSSAAAATSPGPIVAAAARRRIPAALTGSGRAPRAREPARGAVRAARLPLVPDRGPRRARSTASPGGRSRARSKPPTQAEARDAVPAPARRAGAARLRRQPGRARAQRARRRELRRGRARRAAPLRRARLRRAGAARARGTTTGCSPFTNEVGAALRRGRSRPRALGRLRVGAGGRRQARGARPVPVRDRRPPDEERALLRARPAAPSSSRRPTSAACPRSSRSLIDDPDRLERMREAMLARRAAGRGRRDRGGAACARRLAGGASGSPGSAAPGSRRYALLARRRGAPRSRGWDRVETPYLRARPRGGHRGRRRARARPCRTGGRRSSRRRTATASTGRTRAELLAELVAAARLDRRRRRARQDDDGRDDRLHPRPARPRPGLRDRRRRPAARRERRRGGGVARRRGRRVRPHDRRAAAADRRRHERRSRPPQRVRLARRGGALFDGWLAEVPQRRARRRARAGRPASWPCRASTTAGTPRAALAALEAGRRRARPTAEPALAEFPASAAGSSARGEAGGVAVFDDYAHNPAEGRGGGRAPRVSARPGACSCSSSRTCPRARATSAHELGAALAGADAVAVTDVYAARERAGRRRRPGSSVVDALLDAAAGHAGRLDARPRGRRPLPRASARARRRRRDRRRRRRRPAASRAARGAARTIEEGVALSRFTTLGTGGPARWFARPSTVAELEEALAWAAERGSRWRSSGSARTCSSPTRASTRSS